MSRVGKAPVVLPSGVSVEISGQSITVTGPKGSRQRDLPAEISARQQEQFVYIERADDTAQNKALHGLTRSLVNNMVIGVSEGFEKDLRIHGVGYRARLVSPSKIEMALGFSHVVNVSAPEGIEFEVPQPTQILVKGIDKQLVGQVAADIRRWRKPEPYKGKGIRYSDERVRRKAGKAAKK